MKYYNMIILLCVLCSCIPKQNVSYKDFEVERFDTNYRVILGVYVSCPDEYYYSMAGKMLSNIEIIDNATPYKWYYFDDNSMSYMELLRDDRLTIVFTNYDHPIRAGCYKDNSLIIYDGGHYELVIIHELSHYIFDKNHEYIRKRVRKASDDESVAYSNGMICYYAKRRLINKGYNFWDY